MAPFKDAAYETVSRVTKLIKSGAIRQDAFTPGRR